MIMNYNLHYYNYDLVRTFHFLYTHSTVITTIIRRLTVTMVTTIAVMVVAIATQEYP